MTTLFFDENLSFRLPSLTQDFWPGSSHPELLAMRGCTDTAIWKFAADQGHIIVSKDDDFRQRVLLYGPPPKVLWLTIGNSGTKHVVETLRRHGAKIEAFSQETETGLLILPPPTL